MNIACRMMDENTNYRIRKLPALNMSTFFYTTPSSCDGVVEKDVIEQEDTNNNRLLVGQNEFVNRKLSRPNRNELFETPEIHITANDNLLNSPVSSIIPTVGNSPVSSIIPTVGEMGNKKIPVLDSRPTSLDLPDAVGCRPIEKSLQRTQSEQFILQHYINDTKNTKSRKRVNFWNISRSMESLDIAEPGTPTTKRVNKTPAYKRRFQRVGSEPYIDPLVLRNDHSPSKSLMKSPFNARKQTPKQSPKLSPDDEKKKMHWEMLNYIRNDNCKGFRSLLKKRIVDINVITKDGSLIHDASYRGCTKCIKSLLKAGCYVNLCDDLGWSPLHAAVISEHMEAVKLLLDNYALPNQLNYDGLSPCHLAVITGDLYIMHELMKAGGDPLVKDSSITPFQLAIDLKKTVILDYFLHMPSFLVDV